MLSKMVDICWIRKDSYQSKASRSLCELSRPFVSLFFTLLCNFLPLISTLSLSWENPPTKCQSILIAFKTFGSGKWCSERRDWSYGIKGNVEDYVLFLVTLDNWEKMIHPHYISFWLIEIISSSADVCYSDCSVFHCDLSLAVFVVLGTCIAVQLGTNPDWMFFCCFAGTFMFYCAHWQTYVSGTLRFGM